MVWHDEGYSIQKTELNEGKNIHLWFSFLAMGLFLGLVMSVVPIDFISEIKRRNSIQG
jgi:hypothetical protein